MIEQFRGGAMTRRTMLAAISAGGLATAAKAEVVFLPSSAGSADLGLASRDQWSALVGRRFSVAGAAGARLKLVAVEPVESRGPRPRRVRAGAFAAVFEGGADSAQFADSTRLLSTGSAGPVPVFFGNGSITAGKSRLVAIFN